jgi:hypothetical protein
MQVDTTVEEQHLDRAHTLCADYFWPHAQAVFGQAAPTIDQRRVGRVGRWLRRMRPETVSREEVRREALGNTVNADTARAVSNGWSSMAWCGCCRRKPAAAPLAGQSRALGELAGFPAFPAPPLCRERATPVALLLTAPSANTVFSPFSSVIRRLSLSRSARKCGASGR